MFQSITGKPFCPIAAIAAPENFSAGSSRRREPRPSVWLQREIAPGGVSGTLTKGAGRTTLGNTPQARRMFLTERRAPLLTRHHAQAPAVLDHSRTLPQGDWSPRPALAGGEEGGERNLIVLDASDMLHDAFAIRGPGIDAEGEVSSKRRGHLRLLLPDLLRTSRNSLGPLRSRRLRRCRSSSVADGSLRRSISWPAI